MREDDFDPWDRMAWQPLLDFVETMKAQRAMEATVGLDADADLDGWLAAMFEALRPSQTVWAPPGVASAALVGLLAGQQRPVGHFHLV